MGPREADIQDVVSPIIRTSLLPPKSQSATRPHSSPVQTCAAVFAPMSRPACVEIAASEADGSKNRSWKYMYD